jgi:hypothetical protein
MQWCRRVDLVCPENCAVPQNEIVQHSMQLRLSGGVWRRTECVWRWEETQ